MAKNNFNKVSTLWTCQTYMEDISTVLKPGEISFGVLFFSANTASVTDVFESIAQMPENNFNKVSTLWACQTYMENMSKVLKPGEISLVSRGIVFSTNTASVTDVFEIIALFHTR